jgi:KUP system potassium uptake protein
MKRTTSEDQHASTCVAGWESAPRPAAKSIMPRWQDRLFIGLTRTASDATDFFQIPTGRVVEVGTQVAV